MPPLHETPELVQYGEGLDVAQILLGKVRRDLKAGTYEIDETARADVRGALDALANSAVSEPTTDELKDIMHADPNKELRNAVTSIAIEQAWPSYARLVLGGGIYRVGFNDEGRSSLHGVTGYEDLPTGEIASLLGASNQDVLSHFICKLFQRDRLVISNDPAAHRRYLDAYTEQTDLDIHATSNFRTIPLTAGSPSVFTTSGTVGIRTHAFGLAALIDDLSALRGFRLSNETHRKSLEYTIRNVTTPQYLLTTSVAIEASMPLANKGLTGLDVEKWTDTGDPGHFFVFPRPEVIRAANQRLREEEERLRSLDEPKTLPAVTYCPAFHGRVESSNAQARIVSIPLDLASLVLRQLDMHFYPRRAE